MPLIEEARPPIEVNWTRFWLAVPALCASLGWVLLAFLLLAGQQAPTQTRYREIAARAFARGDLEAARIACERLLESETADGSEAMFNLALCLSHLGGSREAVALFSQLAPADAPGYPPARLYLAKGLLAQTNLTAQMVKAAETHLLNALGVDPGLVEAHALLGQIYMQSGAWPEASEHLLKVVPTQGAAALQLALVSRAQRDEKRTRQWAERAAKYFADLLARAPGDQPASRLGWAQAQVMLEDYSAALTNLAAGWSQSASAAYPPAMGEVCAAWLQATTQKSPADLAARLKLLQQGLQFAPQNADLLRELIELSQLAGPEAATARGSLNKLLAEAGDFPILHYCLGVDAWRRGAADQARQHFTVAFAQAPQLPAIANNMAMVLSLGEKADFARALAIIQPVVEKLPQNPSFRDTRAHILIKLGRYHEAVADLEFALPLLPDKGRVHQALGLAYRQLGLKELAEHHERLAAGDTASPPASPAK
jgi:tetratricopeptide (TPR) repeat protein